MVYRSFESVEAMTNMMYAAAYIAYMMVGSFFKKTMFKNPVQEKQLFMEYKTMKESKQIEWEDRTEALAEQVFANDTPEIDKCVVFGFEEKGKYYLRFRTGNKDYEAVINRKGELKLYPIAARKHIVTSPDVETGVMVGKAVA